MATIYTYACKDYPGMESCLGHFYAESEGELWQHMELHAAVAHQEDPSVWSDEDKAYLRGLIKTETIEINTP